MYKYGKTSKARLATCHPKLQEIFNEVIKRIDVTIIEGNRSIEKQQEFFRKKLSKCDGINKLSNHNYNPSRAVDAAPYKNGIDWDDIEGFKVLVKIVREVAKEKGYKLVYGADWGWDYPHYELHKDEK